MSTSSRNVWRVRLYCIIGLFTFFTLLYFVPPLFKKNRFSFPIANESIPIQFPLDKSLGVFHFQAAKKPMTLNQVFQASGKKVLLVNLWATWCPPCLEELPGLEQLHRQLQTSYKDKANVPALITISVDEKTKDIRDLYETLDFTPTFPVLLDAKGELSLLVGTSRFPESYLVNNEGKILFKWSGPQDWLSPEVLRKLVEG